MFWLKHHLRLENLSGMLALCWGGEDVVDLAKELNRLAELDDFEQLECRGGAMDGSKLEPDDLKKVAKWPNRTEQLSILSARCYRQVLHYPDNSWVPEVR